MRLDKALPPGPSGWIEALSEFYLIPEGAFLGKWNRFMVGIAVLSHVLITFQACFHHYWIASFAAGYVFDIFFLVDIFFKMHTAYLQGGFWVVFPKEMTIRYLTSTEFKFDVISNFPYDLFTFIALTKPTASMGFILSLTRLPKIIRTARVLIYFRAQEQKLHASFSIQIIKFLTYLIVITHTIACAWYTLACPGGEFECIENSWVSIIGGGMNLNPFNTPATLYITCLYWTVATMTTTGYGDIRATNDAERIFAFFTMTTGTFFYGYVSGTIASTLSNMDSRRVSYQQKMDAVKQYMNNRDMDYEMQQRVIDYYDYVWERNRGIDVKNLFEDMPITFKSEVALSLNNQIIDKASIFHNCSIGFRRRIAISMRLYLFTANEYVVHKGDLGLEMYFITQGRIDIYASDDVKRATASLIEGGHFGEYGVVLGHRHENSAKAICNTDIYVLTREDLSSAFLAYPDDKEKVQKATQDQLKKAQDTRKGRNLETDDDLLEEEFGAVESWEAAVGAQVADNFLILDRSSKSNRGSISTSSLIHTTGSHRKSISQPGNTAPGSRRESLQPLGNKFKKSSIVKESIDEGALQHLNNLNEVNLEEGFVSEVRSSVELNNPQSRKSSSVGLSLNGNELNKAGSVLSKLNINQKKPTQAGFLVATSQNQLLSTNRSTSKLHSEPSNISIKEEKTENENSNSSEV
ncbi:Kinesin-like protein kif27 [Clydaea vesicula]|uniref:Kinesin-like protein kif27 n=1 Tax=Clydaea vesicula TaxID=447962 RepID=A0AAD5XZG4_9FUNG|nr:Kinesin-like protein kif27 [Clydaea vesicula]